MKNALPKAKLFDKEGNLISECYNDVKAILVALLLTPKAEKIQRFISNAEHVVYSRDEFIDNNVSALGVQHGLTSYQSLLDAEFDRLMTARFGDKWKTILFTLADIRSNIYIRRAALRNFNTRCEVEMLVNDIERVFTCAPNGSDS